MQFNPEEYTLSRDINYAQAAIPGLSAPILQFVNGNMQTLEMELFLDTYEQHKAGSRVVNAARSDVRVLVRQVTDLMTIEPATHAPPVLLFTWGSLAFTCVLARATQRFIMFLPDGTPVRARLKVTLQRVPQRRSRGQGGQARDRRLLEAPRRERGRDAVGDRRRASTATRACGA